MFLITSNASTTRGAGTRPSVISPVAFEVRAMEAKVAMRETGCGPHGELQCQPCRHPNDPEPKDRALALF